MASAEAMGLDVEENAGKKVDLGSYNGMNMELDATGADPTFHLVNADYLYEYRLVSAAGTEHFLVDCIGAKANVPALSEVAWQLKAGSSCEQTLEQLGLPMPEPGVYTMSDSDFGYLGYILWEEGGATNLDIHLAAGRPLGIHLVFAADGLTTAEYTCDLPQNLRSSVLRLVAALR